MMKELLKIYETKKNENYKNEKQNQRLKTLPLNEFE